MAEAVSQALCHAYREAFGRILHHNADKALLAAGRSTPRLGGGTVDAPMRLVLGDRATARLGDKQIDVGQIADAAARSWCRANLRFVDVDRQLVVQNEMRPGSAELAGLFVATVPAANDTSIGVGYAPLTETEELTLTVERLLNSPAWKTRFPEIGEDVKVMAVRRDRTIGLTVAAAFVDRYVSDGAGCLARKAKVVEELHKIFGNSRATCRRLAYHAQCIG